MGRTELCEGHLGAEFILHGFELSISTIDKILIKRLVQDYIFSECGLYH